MPDAIRASQSYEIHRWLSRLILQLTQAEGNLTPFDCDLHAATHFQRFMPKRTVARFSRHVGDNVSQPKDLASNIFGQATTPHGVRQDGPSIGLDFQMPCKLGSSALI